LEKALNLLFGQLFFFNYSHFYLVNRLFGLEKGVVDLKKNWYRRMLLSYFPIFLFTVTILIFMSFIMVNEISHKETVKADRISTGYIMDTVSRSLRGDGEK